MASSPQPQHQHSFSTAKPHWVEKLRRGKTHKLVWHSLHPFSFSCFSPQTLIKAMYCCMSSSAVLQFTFVLASVNKGEDLCPSNSHPCLHVWFLLILSFKGERKTKESLQALNRSYYQPDRNALHGN